MSERIGNEAPVLVQTNMAAAYRACDGAPVSIKPGAVVAMAEQLEMAKRLAEDHYGDATKLHMAMVLWLDDARAALAMYNGEDTK